MLHVLSIMIVPTVAAAGARQGNTPMELAASFTGVKELQLPSGGQVRTMGEFRLD